MTYPASNNNDYGWDDTEMLSSGQDENEVILDFSKVLNRILEITGMNQKSLADYLGLSTSAVSQWNKNKTRIDYEHLVKISKLSNTSVDWLLTGEGPMRVGDATPDASSGDARHPAAAAARRQYLESKRRALREGAETLIPILGRLDADGAVEFAEPIARRLDKGEGIAWDDVSAASCELFALNAAWAQNGRFWLTADADCPVRSIRAGDMLLVEPVAEPERCPLRTCLWRVGGRTLLRDWRTDDGVYLVPVGNEKLPRPDRLVGWLVAIV